MEILLALAALIVALISLSKHKDAEFKLERLRREFDEYKRKTEAKDHPAPVDAAPSDVSLDIAAVPETRAALTTPDITKSAIDSADTSPETVTPAPQDNEKPAPSTRPDWARRSESKPTSAPAKPPRKTFEEALGAQWSVWIGGLALLLGAVFLLRYSIEAGVFSPAMRVAMASLLGVVLLGASEWMHRADKGDGTSILPEKFAAKLGLKSRLGEATPPSDDISKTAHIPGVLAAVGVFALLGAAYTAYALYGFLSPTPAFILLGILSLGAIALSLRHGPVLAALGLATSLATPLLVTTESPNIYLLYGYIIIVASAAIAVARRRDWGWLTLITLASLLGWSALSLEGAVQGDKSPVWFGFIALSFAATVILAKGEAAPPRKSMGKSQGLSEFEHTSVTALIWGGVAALLMCAAVIGSTESIPRILSRLNYGLGLAGSAMFVIASVLKPAQRAHLFSGAILGALTLFWALEADYKLAEIIITALVLCGLTIALITRSLLSSTRPDTKPASLIWAIFAVVFPIVVFAVPTAGISEMTDTHLAAIYIGFALLNAAIAFLLRDKAALKPHASIFTIGAAMLYVFAAMLAFDGMSLTFALLLGLVIAALTAYRFGYSTTRALVPAFAGLSAAHTMLIELPRNEAVSSTLIANELWPYLALPAVLCAGAAWALQKSKSDLWTEGLKAFALAFAALFVVFQIRHIMNDGALFADRLSFDELSLQVLTGLCFTLGGTQISRRKFESKAGLERNLLPALMTGLSMLSLVAFALGVCLLKAPLFNSLEYVSGNIAINSLLLGYLAPAVILATIAWFGRTSRPAWYVRVLGGLAGLSLVLYVTSMIRFGFQGADISLSYSLPEGVELYAISAAWLALGIAALVAGLRTARQDIRLASAVLITLTVLKAFLIDMASLEGVLRAMSFVVLGVVLIVIGRVYQNVLSRETAVSGR